MGPPPNELNLELYWRILGTQKAVVPGRGESGSLLLEHSGDDWAHYTANGRETPPTAPLNITH